MEDRGQVALKLDKRQQSFSSYSLWLPNNTSIAIYWRLSDRESALIARQPRQDCANRIRVAVRYALLLARVLPCACAREIIGVIARAFLYRDYFADPMLA